MILGILIFLVGMVAISVITEHFPKGEPAIKKAIWIVRNAEHEAQVKESKQYGSLSKTHAIEFHRVDETPMRMRPGPSVDYIISDEVA